MMYATKSLPPPATPPPEQQQQIVVSRETGLNPAYWTTGGPIDANRQVPASLARPNPSVSNCGLVIVQVERRPQGDGEQDGQQVEQQQELTFIEHRGQWTSQQPLLMQMAPGTHQLIHGSPPTTHQLIHGHVTTHRDESDDGYRTHSSSSSSCSDGHSPQAQIPSESPPPGVVTAIPVSTSSIDPRGTARMAGRVRHHGEVQPGEEGNNLMWLLDFKLDFFNDAEAKEKERYLSGALATSNELMLHQQQLQQQQQQIQQQQLLHQQQQQQQSMAASAAALGQDFVTHTHLHSQTEESEEQVHHHHHTLGHEAQEVVSEEVEGGQLEHLSSQDPDDPGQMGDMPEEFDRRLRKPPYTYTELITQALKDQTALTVSGIYNWITDRYPYFTANDDKWKNSVRHNLSMNPHFRKGNKSKHGAGHLWVLADFDDMDQDDGLQMANTSTTSGDEEDEAARAVRSILGQTEQHLLLRPSTSGGGLDLDQHQEQKELFLQAELAAVEEANKENSGKRQSSSRTTRHALQKSAHDIVKGVKRPSPVEVQYVSSAKLEAPDVFVTTDVHNSAGLPPPTKRSLLDVDGEHHVTLQHHDGQLIIQTSEAFEPMEQIEELDVVASYCYDEDVASLEKALGIDLQQQNGGGNTSGQQQQQQHHQHQQQQQQRELMAK